MNLKKLFSNQQAVVIAALVVICIVFSLLTDKFLQATTFTNISKSAYYVAFMAIGVTFVISTGGIDLSIGTVAICAALIGGTFMEKGTPMFIVILIMLLVGAVFDSVQSYQRQRLSHSHRGTVQVHGLEKYSWLQRMAVSFQRISRQGLFF